MAGMPLCHCAVPAFTASHISERRLPVTRALSAVPALLQLVSLTLGSAVSPHRTPAGQWLVLVPDSNPSA